MGPYSYTKPYLSDERRPTKEELEAFVPPPDTWLDKTFVLIGKFLLGSAVLGYLYMAVMYPHGYTIN